MKRLPIVVSFVMFVALCASGTYWAMQLFKTPTRQVATLPPVPHVEVNLNAASSLFGGRQGPVAVATNFQLKGIVAADKPEDSAAILSADGKPPQTVPLNAEVMPGVTVKEVHSKYVLLSDGGVTRRVELPETQQLHVDPAPSDTPPPQSAPQPMTNMPVAPGAPRPMGSNPNPNGRFDMQPHPLHGAGG
jgi:general secretion pathway protein C